VQRGLAIGEAVTKLEVKVGIDGVGSERWAEVRRDVTHVTHITHRHTDTQTHRHTDTHARMGLAVSAGQRYVSVL